MKSYSLFKVGAMWHYRFQVDGARVQKSTGKTVRLEADQVADEAFRAAVARSHGDEPCPKLAQLVQLWLEAHQLTASASHLKAVGIFGRLHLYGLGDVLVKDLTTAQVETARTEHLQGHSPASGNHWLNVLRLLVNWAKKRRMLRERLWDVRNVKIQKKPRVRLPVASTTTWLKAFDKQSKPQVRIIIRLALACGLREMEAVAARWEWFDWQRKTYTPGITKGREATPIPLPAWLIEYLEPHKKANGLVCVNPWGKPYAEGYLRAAMAKANTKTGLKGLTPHRLRGTYCTELLEAGVPMPDVQKVMRHKDIKTTLRYYETDMAHVVKGIDEISRKAKLGGRGNGEPRPSGSVRERGERL